MNVTQKYFEDHGYVVLKGALSKQECDNLTNYMFDLYKKGETTKDPQCPLSDAVYGAPVFDELLQRMAAPIGKSVGRNLLPTYTYSRIYRKGEILKRHKDRPACEISATLTLGFDSKPIWPILFDESKEVSVDLDIGELAVYKGCEILHWREAFKGEWHVQVFFHYVDANGPYKHHYMDGRKEFGKNKENNVALTPEISNQNNLKIQPPSNKNEDVPVVRLADISGTQISKPNFEGVMIGSGDTFYPGYICVDKNFLPELRLTKQECAEILKITKKGYGVTASVGGTRENSKLEKQIRSAKIFNIEINEEYKWIYEKISNVVSIMNKIHFDYEISGITHPLQLIEYDSKYPIPGHYNWHVDAGQGEPATRKISLTAQLTDPLEYDGCDLVINNLGQEIVGTKEQGSIHLFPSNMMHCVTDITRGVRYALVIWIHGSRRFR